MADTITDPAAVRVILATLDAPDLRLRSLLADELGLDVEVPTVMFCNRDDWKTVRSYKPWGVSLKDIPEDYAHLWSGYYPALHYIEIRPETTDWYEIPAGAEGTVQGVKESPEQTVYYFVPDNLTSKNYMGFRAIATHVHDEQGDRIWYFRPLGEWFEVLK